MDATTITNEALSAAVKHQSDVCFSVRGFLVISFEPLLN
jgi:hypothetical protein